MEVATEQSQLLRLHSGVQKDPLKFGCILNWPWPTPASQKELRQFLGLTSYYWRFVKGFAPPPPPPQTNYWKKGKPLMWLKKCWHWCGQWISSIHTSWKTNYSSGSTLSMNSKVAGISCTVWPVGSALPGLDTNADGFSCLTWPKVQLPQSVPTATSYESQIR